MNILRIAPTPSGYLHMGNLSNFVRTYALAKEVKGKLRLRIDDIDFTRVRPEYVEDIFKTLDWLGIEYDLGPQDMADFYKNYSQLTKRDHYESFLKKIKDRFVCVCSRKIVSENSIDGQYSGKCRAQNHIYQKDHSSIRFKTSKDYSFENISPHKLMRDFIIWSKEDYPSYHLVSLIDDLDFKITHIVRGDDLRVSSAGQNELAISLEEGSTFQSIEWFHHPLIEGTFGQKLSKSKNDLSLKEMRETGKTSGEVYQLLAELLNLKDSSSFQKISHFSWRDFL